MEMGFQKISGKIGGCLCRGDWETCFPSRVFTGAAVRPPSQNSLTCGLWSCVSGEMMWAAGSYSSRRSSPVVCGQPDVGWGPAEEDTHVSTAPWEGTQRSQVCRGAGEGCLLSWGRGTHQHSTGVGRALAGLSCEGFLLAESPEKAGNHSCREDSPTRGLRLTAALPCPPFPSSWTIAKKAIPSTRQYWLLTWTVASLS